MFTLCFSNTFFLARQSELKEVKTPLARDMRTLMILFLASFNCFISYTSVWMSIPLMSMSFEDAKYIDARFSTTLLPLRYRPFLFDLLA